MFPSPTKPIFVAVVVATSHLPFDRSADSRSMTAAFWPGRVYGERGTPDSGLAPFLFGRPLGGRKSFETLVRNRFAALDRKAIGAGGKSGLGTLDSVELFA
jgi:hypothetical protein